MILMIYKSEVFKEYILPNTDNENYSITLDKNLFNLCAPITLTLDITEKKWNIYAEDEYSMRTNGEKRQKIELRDGEIIYFKTQNKERFQGIVMDSEMAFHIYKKYDISNLIQISIGKDQTNLVSYQCMELVSKNHGMIVKSGTEYFIEDYSANGIFLNAKRINGRAVLHFGDVINIFGLTMVYLGNILAIGTHYGNLYVNENCLKEYQKQSAVYTDEQPVKRKTKKVYFNRSPRNIPIIARDKIEIEEPPTPQRSKKKPLLYVIGPSFTMAIPMILGCVLVIYSMRNAGQYSGAYMYTGIITAIGSAVLGGLWAALNLRFDKQSEMEGEQERFNAYGNYLIEIADKIKAKYEQNANALHLMYPSSDICSKYNQYNSNLWNRNLTHADFLFQRLGLGQIPFQVEIETPKEKFSVLYDSLKEKPAMIKEEFSLLKNVPVGIDIEKNKLVGIVGGDKKQGALSIVYLLVSQIAANNCYTDVKMVFVYNEERKEQWDFARWLPHVWSEDKNTRYVATNKVEAGDVFYELVNILRRREENRQEADYNKKVRTLPYFVLFIEDEAMLQDEPIAKYVYSPDNKYHMTTFILADKRENLPNSCEVFIQNDRQFSGIYNAMDSEQEKQKIQFDNISLSEISQQARSLADIQVKEIQNSTDIPNQLTFMQMYHANSVRDIHILDRWRKNRTFNTMRVPIGEKAGGSLCYLDVHEKYHGPHGLIAGTTGSGKSETLQTYMLSLALNYSPDDVAFFVIDFKGGGMANLFSDLPHMVGEISNLSGNQIRRAMISIKSENKRRQRVFTEHGVNNINLYTRLYKNGEAGVPMPHLLIIIDEFAELKKEEPEFMKELISVAQVGRSLGVHLILATQKPSGTVDDNIWSNAKFRLCLRVQDRQDSNDMLHKPDAAYITQAGRCYLQVGNDEIYELFQSAWSGAVYDEKDTGDNADIATMLTTTGKTAVVGSRAKLKRKETEKLYWYQKIVSSVKTQLSYHRAGDFDAVRYRTSEIFAKDIIGQMKKDGLDYPENKSNITKLLNFIRLMPDDLSDEEKAAEEIMKTAAKQGIILPEPTEKTQLEAVVEYLNKLAKDYHYKKTMTLWLPVLSDTITLQEISGFVPYGERQWNPENSGWDLDIVVGMYDDPENQSQLPVVIDFVKDGHVAVCGGVVSGKSTLLQTMVYSLINKYSPKELNLYLLDFSSHMLSAFEGEAHIGGIMNENHLDRIEKFFHMINEIMNSRKKQFDGGNYQQYTKVHGTEVPAIIIVIDNVANFREKTDGKYDFDLIRLSREGVGYGIFLLISGAGFGISEIPGRVADNIKNVIALNLGDKFKYMDTLRLTRISVLPEEGIKGRGLVNVGGNILEFQAAVSIDAQNDYDRTNRIMELCRKINREWTGAAAKPIPEIPENPDISELMLSEEFQQKVSDFQYLPYAYSLQDASVYCIDLSMTYCYAVTGKSRTGKTNVLKVLMKSAHEKNAGLCVIETGQTILKKTAEQTGAEYLSGEQEIFDYWKRMSDIFVERNRYKQELIAQDYDETEIFEKMQKYRPIFIFIDDLVQFVEMMYKPNPDVGEMYGFMENIIEKGSLHNIYFIGAMEPEACQKVAGYKIYEKFVGYKTGVHLGGNLAAQRLYNFSNIPFNELSKTYKKGIGITPSYEDETIAEKIVIPLMGREK